MHAHLLIAGFLQAKVRDVSSHSPQRSAEAPEPFSKRLRNPKLMGLREHPSLSKDNIPVLILGQDEEEYPKNSKFVGKGKGTTTQRTKSKEVSGLRSKVWESNDG